MPKLTLEEKRLQTLRRQLTGKSNSVDSKSVISNQTTVHLNTERSEGPVLNTDYSSISYLRSDLLKIFYLSAGAILIQLALFFASRNHLLKLNF